MSWNRYRQWFRDIEETAEYQTAGLEIEFTEELCRVMEGKVSRAELARRAGTSPAYITKILRGSTNFTLATMAKMARALDMELRLHLAPRGSRTIWKDELSAPASWPERQDVVRQVLEVEDGSEIRGLMAESSILETEPVGISKTVFSATLEMEGETGHEGPADQAA